VCPGGGRRRHGRRDGRERANADPQKELGDRAETLFTAALYWATGLPTVTISPSLKPDDDGDGGSAGGGCRPRRDAAPRGCPEPVTVHRYRTVRRVAGLHPRVRDGRNAGRRAGERQGATAPC